MMIFVYDDLNFPSADQNDWGIVNAEKVFISYMEA